MQGKQAKDLSICVPRYFSEFHSQKLKAKNWVELKRKGFFFFFAPNIGI